jgi:hypothetical protein
MSWAKASIPVALVTAGGRLRVLRGSRITLSGISLSFTMPILSSCSGTSTMALGVASEPVPAVVGTISMGRPRRWMGTFANICSGDNVIERLNKEFKQRPHSMEILAGEAACYRLLAFISLGLGLHWRANAVGKGKPNLPFYRDLNNTQKNS